MHSSQPRLQHNSARVKSDLQMTDNSKAQLSSWLQQIAKARDKQAFSAVFSWFAPKIKRFGIKQFSSEATANELIQTTLSNVWRKAHLYNPDKGAATTWVYSIMRNAAFDIQRKIHSQREDQLSDDIWPMVESSTVTDQVFTDHLALKQLQSLLQLLPANQKQVVEAVYFQELSHEQLAKQLGVPLGTVKSRLRLAMAKLKQQLGGQS